MKVLTKYPVYVDKERVSDANFYLNLDGTNPAQVKAFQNWLDIKYPTWFNNGKMSGDVSKGYGTYNDATKQADATYGKEFEAQAKALFGTLGTITQGTIAEGFFTPFKPIQDLNKAEADAKKAQEQLAAEEKEKKKKKMRNNLLIIGGGVIVAGIIIYLLVRTPSKTAA